MNLLNYRHIIFDWNGTLLNDILLAVDVIDKMLVKRGLPGMTVERYSQIFDFPVKNYYQNIGFNFNIESFENIGTEFILEYDKRQYECELQKGSIRFIEKLFHKKLHLSILSAREQSMLEQNLTYYGLMNFFSIVSGLKDHYANGKIENGLKLINESHILPSETLLIGDTLHDFEVAKEMGIDCIFISSGHQSINRLLATGIPIYNCFMDIEI